LLRPTGRGCSCSASIRIIRPISEAHHERAPSGTRPRALISALLERLPAADLVLRRRIRIGVTGLARAGKTAFLTSLAANLLAAGNGRPVLPALTARLGGRRLRVTTTPAAASALPRFDARRHLDALIADPPRWPARTEAASLPANGCSTCRCCPPGSTTGRPRCCAGWSSRKRPRWRAGSSALPPRCRPGRLRTSSSPRPATTSTPAPCTGCATRWG
jgi:hypothetical protein